MKDLLKMLPEDFPIIDRPYDAMARPMGITGEELIQELTVLKSKGIIRRISLIAAHRALLYKANAMVAWRVPQDRSEEVGAILADFREVSHCYERDTAEYWPYNIYTMVHAQVREECFAVIKTMSERSGIQDYQVLFSLREFKKTSFSVRT